MFKVLLGYNPQRISSPYEYPLMPLSNLFFGGKQERLEFALPPLLLNPGKSLPVFSRMEHLLGLFLGLNLSDRESFVLGGPKIVIF